MPIDARRWHSLMQRWSRSNSFVFKRALEQQILTLERRPNSPTRGRLPEGNAALAAGCSDIERSIVFKFILTRKSKMSGELPLNINIKEPRWDQGTFMGRAKHFFMVTDPRNVLLPSETLEEARVIVENYRAGVVTPGLTEDQLWRAKYVYDSAFHPDTGEKMLVIGRMSAQVPMNMSITGCMLTFYRTTPAVVFWQWVNQSFNAVVNYTNRSGDAPITVNQLGAAYVSATTGAVVTALGLKSLTTRLPPIVSRFVPFAAVAAANCINIPFMRQRELKYGIPVTDENGNRLGESANAAQQAIIQVVVSRIGMAVPAMAIPPVIMNALEKRAFMKRFPILNAPIQVGLVGLCLVFATPLCCALFPQKSSMKVSGLEPDLQERIRQSNETTAVVYFNKGL
ncbi:sideroflexin-3 isoform X2 [Syngnathoides biaculeatus]|uniref:sideroflexin-3 isoform X2 n=1 Tax=Syngnathoides biaculeatus TaxID=300417 RepID=UPI002ADE0013|nr:sideroflexin-3 isoform X2 [Syngnathoides biaculeatus]XP_061692236.1 sideroflexin-3 isoform X2 [Syngnathoides biaculeatus]